MLTGGYIKLHRKITDWEWYHDATVTRVFIHLLLTANYEPKKFEGMTIGAGERVISLQGLADEVGFSKGTIVRVLNCLEKTGELKRRVTAKFTIITLKNYTAYNDCEPQADRSLTDCEPQADPMEESKKARKQEGKKGGGSKAPAYPPLTPEQKKSLVEIYGEENVNRCIDAIKAWKTSQGRSPDVDFILLDRWIREDLEKGRIKLPKVSGDSRCSFKVSELEETAMSRYRKKGT